MYMRPQKHFDKYAINLDNEIRAIMFHCKQHNSLPKKLQGRVRKILDQDLRNLPISPEYRSEAAEQLRKYITENTLYGFGFREYFNIDNEDAASINIPTFINTDKYWANIQIVNCGDLERSKRNHIRCNFNKRLLGSIPFLHLILL